MSRRARVGQLEARIKDREHRESFDWEATHGEIGVLTRDCVLAFLANTEHEHAHQLMLIGGFALTQLQGKRVSSKVEKEYLRQLLVDPDYRGFGYTEEKHPKALKLFHMCAARGGWKPERAEDEPLLIPLQMVRQAFVWT